MANTYKTTGIVLRCIKYSETSVIVDIYTLLKGLRTYIVSGLGSKKDRSKASCFQHLNILEIVAYDKPANKLARIKEQKIVQHYKTLPYDVRKSSVGLFSLEVCREAIKESEPNAELYHFLEQYFVMLDNTTERLSNTAVKFLLELANYIGIRPEHNYSDTNPYLDMLAGTYVADVSKYTLTHEISEKLYKLMISDWIGYSAIVLSKRQQGELLDHMVTYYKLQLDQVKELKSLQVLRDIF